MILRVSSSSRVLVVAIAMVLSTSTFARADERYACAAAAESAQTLRGSQKLVEARRRLLVCSRESCPLVVRTDCLTWLFEVERSTPTLVFRAHDAAGNDLTRARVDVDGATLVDHLDGTLVSVDPGEHTFRITADGFAPFTRTLLVAQGEKNRVIDITLTAASTATTPAGSVAPRAAATSVATTPTRTLPYLLGGVGIASLGVFAGFETSAQLGYADLRDGCGQTASCAPNDVDALRTRFVVAGVSLAVGALLVGVATYLFLSETPATVRTASRAR